VVLRGCTAAGLRASGSQTRLHHRPAEKSLECTGTLEFRGVQADLGEVVAWRNMFWALSDRLKFTSWVNGAYLPDHAAL
jgi:aromatic ring hydroxylase